MAGNQHVLQSEHAFSSWLATSTSFKANMRSLNGWQAARPSKPTCVRKSILLIESTFYQFNIFVKNSTILDKNPIFGLQPCFWGKFAYFLDRKSILHIQIAFCYVNDPFHTYKTPCFLTFAIIFCRTFWLSAIKRAHVRFEGRAGCQPLRERMLGNQHVLQNEHAFS